MTFWSTTPNLFDNITKRSMRKMLVLGKDHLSKLKAQQADAVINALYVRTEPLLTGFALRYTERSNAKAQYKGHTAKMNGLLKELRQLKVKQWDVQIQNHHLQGTAEYAALCYPIEGARFKRMAPTAALPASKPSVYRWGNFRPWRPYRPMWTVSMRSFRRRATCNSSMSSGWLRASPTSNRPAWPWPPSCIAIWAC